MLKVLNALVLVNHDSRENGGTLSKHAKQSLAHMWACQEDSGSWLWLDFGLKPWETGDGYYAAALAAIAAGRAERTNPHSTEVQGKVEKLRQYLQRGFANQSLHNRSMALWASAELRGVLTKDDVQKVIKELLDIQAGDGGWNVSDFGPKGAAQTKWTAQGEYPAGAKSDGYATGLVVYVLERAG